MQTLLPAEASTRIAFTVNGRVLLFAAVLAIATGFVFGLFPALHLHYSGQPTQS